MRKSLGASCGGMGGRYTVTHDMGKNEYKISGGTYTWRPRKKTRPNVITIKYMQIYKTAAGVPSSG